MSENNFLSCMQTYLVIQIWCHCVLFFLFHSPLLWLEIYYLKLHANLSLQGCHSYGSLQAPCHCTEVKWYLNPVCLAFGLETGLHANCMAHTPSQCNVGVTYLIPRSPTMQMNYTASLLLSDATMLSASSAESATHLCACDIQDTKCGISVYKPNDDLLSSIFSLRLHFQPILSP